MARLDAAQKQAWKSSLDECDAAWVVFGVDSRLEHRHKKLEGMAGIIDWRLHGRVSDLFLKNTLEKNSFCLLLGKKEKINFLLCHFDGIENVKSVAKKLEGLRIKEISLAETTFPEDFLVKLKQTLLKEGIRFKSLEPNDKEVS